MEIYLIRHTSVEVPKDVFYGQSDVPLKECFPQEAAVVKERLAEIKAGFLPDTDFDYVFTSPLSRCVRLAEYCGYGEVAIRDNRLKEINFGEWELQRFDDVKDPVLQQWYADYLHVRATGGESFQDQYARVAEFLQELEQRYGEKGRVVTAETITDSDHEMSGGNALSGNACPAGGRRPLRIAVFAHGGVILCARIFSGEITPEQAFSSLTPYGGIVLCKDF